MGEGSGREQCHLLCSGQLSVASPTTHKQIGPFWCRFPSGWVCVHSRTLWVSPMNFPVILGVSPTAETPTGFYSQRFWGFLFPHWNPGLCGLSHSPVVHPGLSAHKCGTACSASHCLSYLVLQGQPCHVSSLPWLPVSTPPTGLDECFFFISLVVGLPYSMIFWKFWLFFVFKFCCPSFGCTRSKVYLPMPPCWPEESYQQNSNQRITGVAIFITN